MSTSWPGGTMDTIPQDRRFEGRGFIPRPLTFASTLQCWVTAFAPGVETAIILSGMIGQVRGTSYKGASSVVLPIFRYTSLIFTYPLNPSGSIRTTCFNTRKLCILPIDCIYVCRVVLTLNSVYSPKQH
jgi:hypothetical protein